MGLGLTELGLLIGGVVVARILLSHRLPPDEIPVLLRPRIAMIDSLHSLLWLASAALCLAGLGLYFLEWRAASI